MSISSGLKSESYVDKHGLSREFSSCCIVNRTAGVLACAPFSHILPFGIVFGNFHNDAHYCSNVLQVVGAYLHPDSPIADLDKKTQVLILFASTHLFTIRCIPFLIKVFHAQSACMFLFATLARLHWDYVSITCLNSLLSAQLYLELSACDTSTVDASGQVEPVIQLTYLHFTTFQASYSAMSDRNQNETKGD